jgi:hypothetical protein
MTDADAPVQPIASALIPQTHRRNHRECAKPLPHCLRRLAIVFPMRMTLQITTMTTQQ